MMFIWESLMVKTWHFTFPEPDVFQSISRKTLSLVLTRQTWCHGAKVHEQPKFVVCVEPCEGHFGGDVFGLKVPADLLQQILCLNAIIVDLVGSNVLERPALRVHSDVEPAVHVFWKGYHLFSHDMIVCELLAAVVHAGCLVCQFQAAHCLKLYLNVCQLVDQLWCVWAFHNLWSRHKRRFANKIVVEGLRVENRVIVQNHSWLVQLDEVVLAKDNIESFDSIHTRCFCHPDSSESSKVFRFESLPAACCFRTHDEVKWRCEQLKHSRFIKLRILIQNINTNSY